MTTPASVDNYTIGKGVMSIAAWIGQTPPSGYDSMGNCPSVEVEPAIERLPHYSSMQSFRLKDANPVIQTEYMINFTCDEIAAINLNKFLLGTLTGVGYGSVISMLQSANVEYAIQFVSANPIGANYTWEFWKGTLSPNGALQLIGEEWMTMDFTFEGLADTANHAASPYADVTQSSSSLSSSSSSSSG